MSLENISSQLSGHISASKNTLPPVEEWHPDFCGDIDLQIKKDGSWFYNGTIFKRLSLVKLFASVLKKEDDKYYLVTPVEKVGIEVEDVPFVLTNWHWQDETQTNLVVSTNLDDEFILTKEHPLTIAENGGLYVSVRRNLLAKVHRNVYYQWVDIAREVKTDKGTELMLCSAGEQFSLGILEPRV
ncbi:MAG: DUF1285 domain-containing protein [Alteromonadaceae bacterium]|nr:DUF1285 domain-containing protein [Alteromonadaceae bacterium]